MRSSYTFLLSLVILAIVIPAKAEMPFLLDLIARQDGPNAQIEIGSQYVGVEMHESSIAPRRIAFFLPRANVIDVTREYWKRKEDPVMLVGLRIGGEPIEWLTRKSLTYEVSPYDVQFKDTNEIRELQVSYQFCKNRPAMVFEVTLTNTSVKAQEFEFNTRLETVLRTSHLYEQMNSAWTEASMDGPTIYTNHESVDTGKATIFVANAGEKPASFTTDADEIWNPGQNLSGKTMDRANPKRPVADFLYRRILKPGEKMTITQIIGSEGQSEAKRDVRYLLQNYRKEIRAYEKHVRLKTQEAPLVTGDHVLDRTARWAKAILTTSDRLLEGRTVPMPCPAQYNMYFTHDVLMTDYTAVFFDTARVRRDLEFIADHAGSDNIIPHAYYWSKDHYETEFVRTDGWNHFWFLIDSARYFRHTGDLSMLKHLYPLLLKSVEQMLINYRDGTIWANRPDWWDLGTNFGPRSYMTILAHQALMEFVYISRSLGINTFEYRKYDQIADQLAQGLNDKLWDSHLGYLMNYLELGQEEDLHFYIGSMLATHFGLLNLEKSKTLLDTAEKQLLDPGVGIMNATPVDFHLAEVAKKYRFNGPEAGPAFYYMNGGSWYQGNAWYALGLIETGQKEKAYQFIRSIMTIDGIQSGPNGQPALYEVRNTNRDDSSVHGTVDKPQFLWAGAWYLNTVYRLLGLKEGPWNLYLDPYLPPGSVEASFTIQSEGKALEIVISGTGKWVRKISCDEKRCDSLVIPKGGARNQKLSIDLGQPETPYVASTSSELISAQLQTQNRTLVIEILDLEWRESNTRIISPWPVKEIRVNKILLTSGWKETSPVPRVHELELFLPKGMNKQTTIEVIYSK